MKVLLVGEGASELAGALETLVRRLGLAEAEIAQDRVSRRELHAHHGKGRGYFKRAVRWMLEAQKRGHEALVLVIDEDGRPERLQEFADAQQYAGTPIRRAFGVAIRTFDAWMLADEKALTEVLGCTVSRQQTPESIVEPKRRCGELLDNSAESMTASEMYTAIARIIDIGVLQTRCRKGFAPFAQRVQEL
jgi:hypothetical protein